ncbi:metallophosphoesterase family protein [Thermocladium modestius]|nr:metallophosphoesterase [Thermocladium modestius]
MLFISDLHKSYDSLEEMRSIEWLLGVLDEFSPDYLISAGDNGEGMTPEDFHEITRRAKLIMVYGNHENFAVARMNSIPDGHIVRAGGIKVSGINGLIGSGRREYYTSPEKLMRLIGKLRGIDIFVSHQPPYLPEAYPGMTMDEGSIRMLEFIREVKPRLHLYGHMTGGCYSFHGPHLRVDSSARFRCFATIEEGEVAIYDRDGLVERLRAW